MGWRWGPRGSCKGWNVLARRPPEVRWRSAEPVPRAVLGDKAVERVVRTVCASLRAMGSVVAGENGVPEGECILAFAANKERPAWGRMRSLLLPLVGDNSDAAGPFGEVSTGSMCAGGEKGAPDDVRGARRLMDAMPAARPAPDVVCMGGDEEGLLLLPPPPALVERAALGLDNRLLLVVGGGGVFGGRGAVCCCCCCCCCCGCCGCGCCCWPEKRSRRDCWGEGD